MKRVSRLKAAFCVWCLPLVSYAQFAAPDPSLARGPAASPFGQQGTSSFAPSTDQIKNSGLGIRILFVGRNQDGKQLTISAELQNLTEEPVYLALVGPPPSAVDSSGVTYELATLAGLSQCARLSVDRLSSCITNTIWNGTPSLPGAGFSLLEPGSRAIVAVTFTTKQSGASGFVSVTMNALMAKGARPKDDRSKGGDNMTNLAISFPIAAIPEVK